MFSAVEKPAFHLGSTSVHSQLFLINETLLVPPWVSSPFLKDWRGFVSCLPSCLSMLRFQISERSCEDAQDNLAPLSSVPKMKRIQPTQVTGICWHFSGCASSWVSSTTQSQINWLPGRKLRRKKKKTPTKTLLFFSCVSELNWSKAAPTSTGPGTRRCWGWEWWDAGLLWNRDGGSCPGALYNPDKTAADLFPNIILIRRRIDEWGLLLSPLGRRQDKLHVSLLPSPLTQL